MIKFPKYIVKVRVASVVCFHRSVAKDLEDMQCLSYINWLLQGIYKPNVVRVASAEAMISTRAQAVAIELMSDAWINLSKEEWQHRSAWTFSTARQQQ